MEPDRHGSRDAERADLVRDLAARGVSSPAVLAAMGRVHRHRFLPAELETLAYRDRALPIPCGQTISQPFVVATMTEIVLGSRRRLGRVLEVGTGSGYQCAVLAAVSDEVYSIERIGALHHAAGRVLQEEGIANVRLRQADGSAGWKEAAPFDGVVVTAAAGEIAASWVQQLADPGVLVAPVGTGVGQDLVELRKDGGSITRRSVYPVLFVPLLAGIES